MGHIYTSARQLIGGTPLLELSRLAEAEGLGARLLAKLEYLNPAGSSRTGWPKRWWRTPRRRAF